MKADKLVEAFVVVNSTPQMQIEALLRNVNDNERFLTELTVKVFRLPKKKRTFIQLKNELALMFVRQLGMWGTVSAVFSGLLDKSGPMEGVQISLINRACKKMGYVNPIYT